MNMFALAWLVALAAATVLTYVGEIPARIAWWILASGPLWLLLSSVRVVDQWNRVVVLRLGRFAGLRGPGIVLLIPFAEWVSEMVDTRIRTQSLTSETAMTKDSVSVSVEAVMVWRVVDARKAAVDVADYRMAVERAGLVSLRETIGAVNLDDLLSDFEGIDERIKAAMVRRTQPWGVAVDSVDIKDIGIAAELQAVMSRDAQAQREQRARVTLAGAEEAIARKMRDAALIYDGSPMALRLREMELVHEMGKDKSTIIIPTEMIGSVSGGLVGGVIGQKLSGG